MKARIAAFSRSSRSNRDSRADSVPSPTHKTCLIKVAMLGDPTVGKTSLMNQYVEGTFEETQLPTEDTGVRAGGRRGHTTRQTASQQLLAGSW